MRRLAALLLLATAALPSGSASAQDTRSCGWAVVISGTQLNVAFPDEAATYWSTSQAVPPGGHIEIHGQFPHARYTSLVTYTGQTQAVESLYDAQILPDPGSANPFLPGADRTAAKRHYTVRVLSAQAPAENRPPNTLYTTNADGSKSSTGPMARVLLRIYEGDNGLGRAGGVPLPEITVVTSDGQRTTLPQCPNALLPDAGLASTMANAGPNEELPPTGTGGTDPPVWHRYTNAVSGVILAATDHQATGGAPTAVTDQTDATVPSGGFYENPDNKYVTTTFSRGIGQVLAFRAKAPTYPSTRDGQPFMGTSLGDAWATGQVRYWSFCTNAQTTAYYACKQDDQVPLDANGEYTIVVSTAAGRPRNANEACGVAWVAAGPFPQSLLIMRNMLPAASFAQAIQNAQPGTEQQTMGAYYPRGKYYATTADFEALGCPA
jgi:hypothetical protein